MYNIFFASDLHLGHQNICKFQRDDGTPLRPWDDVNEMNECIIENWNRVVKPTDKVYDLGDVVMKRAWLPLVGRLNGKKRLIRGNHDIFNTKEYAEYYDEIYGVRVLEDMILSHYPLHRESINRETNVHGHLHYREIPDGKYFNVSMECIDYKPISLEDLRQQIAAKKAKYIELDYEVKFR